MGGYILGSFSVSIILSSLFIDKIIKKIGRQNTLYLGPMMEGLAFTVFGLISVFNTEKTYFIFLALIARLF